MHEYHAGLLPSYSGSLVTFHYFFLVILWQSINRKSSSDKELFDCKEITVSLEIF